MRYKKVQHHPGSCVGGALRHLAFVEQPEDEAPICISPDYYSVSRHSGQVALPPLGDIGSAAIPAQQLKVP